jgi:hypothetical protein
MIGRRPSPDNIFLAYTQDIGMGSRGLHKMLNSPSIKPGFAKAIGMVILMAVIGLVAMEAFTWNRESVFYGGEVFYTDGDCYSRMTRVRMIEEGGLRSIRSHAWENFSEGTVPHTTMPLDALIAGISAALAPFTARHLALAGAWVSPALGIATVFFLMIWGLVVKLPHWWAMGLMAGVSPILAHGFEVGRPDHQSVLVFLIAVALAAELAIWSRRQDWWGYVAAAAWALALWVSLFEPLVMLAAVLVGRLIARRWQVDFKALAVFAAILLAALWIDGWRAAPFHEAFGRWALNIGELRHAGLGVIFSWCGWMALAAVLILAWRAYRGAGRLCGLFAGLLVLLGALCFWHARWGYFLALVFAISLPWTLAAFRWRWLGVLVFLISLWPVAGEWERMLYPDDEAFRARVENIADAVALREAALSIQNLPEGGVLAPWWFCPAIVWWSGKPCTGGTSHQSLPGIVDSCRFYLATDDATAREILKKRDVRYVFAYEPARVLSNSAQILGEQPSGHPLAERLYKNSPTPGLKPVFRNRFFKVCRVAE